CGRTVTIVPPPVQLLCSNLTITCGSPISTNPPAIAPCCSSVTVTQLSSTTITNGCGRTIYQVWRATDCCANSVLCTQVVNVVAPLGGVIVVPNTNLNTFGNANNGYPFNFNTHYQQVYASNQFGAMPSGGAFITALGFRVATNFTGFGPTTL